MVIFLVRQVLNASPISASSFSLMTSELSGGMLLALAAPLFSAVGMFTGRSVFPMPLSTAVRAFCQEGSPSRGRRRGELVIVRPGLGAFGD